MRIILCVSTLFLFLVTLLIINTLFFIFPPGHCNTSIQCHETLTYLDLTFRPHLILHIQKLPAHLDVYEYKVEQCFCTDCSIHNNLQNCVHKKTIEARSEDNDDLTLPIDITEEYGNFFFVVYASSKFCDDGVCCISRTQTLTSMFVSLCYI
jgi:hypothetical protein